MSRSTDSSTVFESSINTAGTIIESSNSTGGRTSLSNIFEITPSSTLNKTNLPPNSGRKPSRLNILQLNEETNTWKVTPKNQRRIISNRRNNIHSSIIKLQSYLKQENAHEFRFRIIVALLFFTILVMVLLTRYFHYHLEINLSIANQIYMHKNTRKITFLDRVGNNLLNINYGLNIPSDIQPVNCRSISQSNKLCLDWKYRAHLSVKYSRVKYINSFTQEDTVTCYKFKWQSYEKYSALKDCFDMSDSHWYGLIFDFDYSYHF